MRFMPPLCSALLLSALSTHAQQAVLVGTDLEPQAIQLRSYTNEGVAFEDWQGNAQTLELDQVLRMDFVETLDYRWPEGAAAFTLSDGQRVVGPILEIGEDGESVIVDVTGVGFRVEVSLDDLMSIGFVDGIELAAEGDDDAVLLVTGETLVGFVEALEEGAVSFVVGDADDAISIPFERVMAIAIANTPTTPEAEEGQRLTRVELIDGSRVDLTDAQLHREDNPAADRIAGQTTLEIGAAALNLPLRNAVSVQVLSSDKSLAALTGSPYELESGGEVFGVATPPRVLSDGALLMHAPTELAFDLPTGASRLALSVALDLDASVPADRRALAGCELVIEQGGEVLATVELTHDAAPRRVNVEVDRGELTLHLRPGINGPVLDRVRVTDAQLLVTRP